LKVYKLPTFHSIGLQWLETSPAASRKSVIWHVLQFWYAGRLQAVLE